MSKYLSTLFYLVVSALPLATNFLLLPIYTKYLSPREFGELTILNLSQTYIFPVVGIGLVGAFNVYFYDNYKDIKKLRVLRSSTILSMILSFLICSIFLSVFGKNIFVYFFPNLGKEFYQLFFPIVMVACFLGNVQQLFFAFFRNSENIRSVAYLMIPVIVCSVLGSFIGVVVLREGVLGSYLGKVIGLSIGVVPFLIYFLVKDGFVLDKNLIYNMLGYSIPLLLYSFIGVIIGGLDKVFVESELGISKLGMYNIAFLIGTIPNFLLGAIQASMYPSIFKSFKTMDDTSKAFIFQQFSFIIGIIYALIIAVNITSGFIVKTFLDSRYHDITYLIPFIGSFLIFRAFYVILVIPVDVNKKSKYLSYINGITLVITFFVGKELVSKYGLIGAGGVLVIINFLQMIMACLFVVKMGELKKEIFGHFEFIFIGAIIFVSTLLLATGKISDLLFIGINGVLLIMVVLLLGIKKTFKQLF